MAIHFDWFETPSTQAGGKRTLHARPCFNGTSKMKTIAKHIQVRCSLTVGDIMAVQEVRCLQFAPAAKEGG